MARRTLPLARRALASLAAVPVAFPRPHFSPFAAMAAAAVPLKPSAASSKEDLAVAQEFLAFNDGSSSVFHATLQAQKRLLAAGFTKLKEGDEWTLAPGGKYFLTRNQSSLLAFVVGGEYTPGNGVAVVAAHTDSPCLKVKPISKQSREGYLQVGVQTYGGGLWHTWFDRDLSVAGRVIVKTAGGGFKTRLVKVPQPICRISNVAIHLTTAEERKAFAVNKEEHLAPILATAAADALNAPAVAPGDAAAAAGDAGGLHHSALLTVLAGELGVAVEDIVDVELALYDTQPCAVGGVFNEFIFAPRLDNLASAFASTAALAAYAEGEGVAAATHTAVVALFDHEEVGSESGAGAGGTLMQTLLSALAGGDSAAVRRCVRQSLLVSADMAHSVHPNYAHKHERAHRPVMNAGCVVKHNVNQRYATNVVTTHMFKQFASEAGVPLQHFVVRQDMGCGTTIGPILAASLGMPTVDVGVPQLSMHSIRETCGVADLAASVKLYGFALASQPAAYAGLEGQDELEE